MRFTGIRMGMFHDVSRTPRVFHDMFHGHPEEVDQMAGGALRDMPGGGYTNRYVCVRCSG